MSRLIEGAKKAKESWGAVRFWVALGAIGALSLNGVYQFLRDAPALVNSNTAAVAELRMEDAQHLLRLDEHDTTLVSQKVFIEAVVEHLEDDDAANEETAQQLRWLTCWRVERERERDSLPALQDCNNLLLPSFATGGGG